MIGKPEWFERRKYSGWGLHPKTWRGWAYIAAFIIPFAIFQSIPIWNNTLRLGVSIVWISILLLDVFHIMANLKKDEREEKIEAISERNAAWMMVAVATIGIVYQLFNSALNQKIIMDWFLVAVLVGGVFVKSISNIVLERSKKI